MSVTTTSNPLTYATAEVLRDYDLRHSSDELDTSLNSHPAPASPNNPAHWPADHRRVPAYRPVNTQLDQSERRVYLNPIERIFVATMFTGVFLQSVSHPSQMGKRGHNADKCSLRVRLGELLVEDWGIGYKLGGEW
jgi:hypothetical protein